jgi:hypothetical protein
MTTIMDSSWTRYNILLSKRQLLVFGVCLKVFSLQAHKYGAFNAAISASSGRKLNFAHDTNHDYSI